MQKPHLVIIGGGLAGLSAGCYACSSGFEVTVLEHNLALGGVCTAWTRAPYTIDGCIHWLTGGPFERLYRELGIVPAVGLHTLDHFLTYRDLESETCVAVTRDLDGLARKLKAISPADAKEIDLIVRAARHVSELEPPLARPQELTSMREGLLLGWEMRHFAGELVHFRKSTEAYLADHIESPVLRRLFGKLFLPGSPALFLVMMLGYLGRGFMSRPVGGTTRFRDALVETFQARGGKARLNTTVDEILVEDGRARGVRLSDGSILAADYVISTSSMPETIMRLLGGRFALAPTVHKLEHWKMFDPIVLVSFGVESALAGVPPTLLVDHVPPVDTGGTTVDHLYLRIYNDDPSVAPPGHTVIQAMLSSRYEHWATRGPTYHTEKQQLAERVLAAIEPHVPGVSAAVRMTDVATPLTYWGMARSWRGAYEGWEPNGDSLFGHVDKRVDGVAGFCMAGQWVEPGGGVPTALLSGRQAVQIMCAERDHPFSAG